VTGGQHNNRVLVGSYQLEEHHRWFQRSAFRCRYRYDVTPVERYTYLPGQGFKAEGKSFPDNSSENKGSGSLDEEKCLQVRHGNIGRHTIPGSFV
jgi:hypothetical protein